MKNLSNSKYPEILWEFSLVPSLLNIKKVNFCCKWNINQINNQKDENLNAETYYVINYIIQKINDIYLNKADNLGISIKKIINKVVEDLKKSKNIWKNCLYQKIKVCQLEKKLIKLRHDSLTDPLTWLANRRSIEIEIKKIIALQNRKLINSSIILIDIDFFKRINDCYWHDIWDKALVEISKIFKEEVRESDIVWRLWWEEFVIIMHWIIIKQAEEKAQSIRKKIQDTLWYRIEEINKEITISIWVSQTVSLEKSWKHLIKRADNALYNAKENWRNNVQLVY